MAHGRLFGYGRHHEDLVAGRRQGGLKVPDTHGVDAVVIGQQDTHVTPEK